MMLEEGPSTFNTFNAFNPAEATQRSAQFTRDPDGRPNVLEPS